MGTLKSLALAGVFAAASSAGALAADLLPPPPPPLPPPPIEFAGGWYLRGDIGFSNQDVDKLTSVLPGETIDKGFDSAPFGGLGIGYQFNNWIRADITGEYRGKATFHGLERYRDATLPLGFGTDEYRATKSEWTGLANVYFDLGNWYGFIPFVGVGAGFSNNTIEHFIDVNTVTQGVAFAKERSTSNFAWALHAGMAYRVTPNFTLEFAYRYLNLGDGETGTLGNYAALNCVATCATLQFKDIDSHDFKVGFRWLLAAPAPIYDAPLIRKY
jgi:opacity protein-like surface antigen